MDFKKAKLLVTGGAGFMGSHFVKFWLKRHPKTRLINLDKLTYAGNLANLTGINKYRGYRFIKGDIADKKLIARLVKNVDIIVNFAAETHVDRSIISSGSFVKTDVLGVYNLLENVRQCNPKLYRFVQVSTDEVFGSIKKGQFTAHSPFLPNSPYSASKAGGDLLCRAFYKTYKLPIIMTHSCNFYGPYQYPEKIIPLFITNLLLGLKVPLYGKGQNVREWIYTEDYCSALYKVIEKARPGEKILIGSGERISNYDLTVAILRHMGKDKSYIKKAVDRLGHDWRYAVDRRWLTKQGWKPRITLKKGLLKTIEWYKQNQDWWLPIRKQRMNSYYRKQYRNK